jgi:membrane protein
VIAYFDLPLSWGELIKRTVKEAQADDFLGLSAQLAYYFFLALFPTLLFLIALASFVPADDLIGRVLAMLQGVAPPEVIAIIRDQLAQIAEGRQAGLLSFGVAAALWSSSAAMVAMISALNHAYDVEDARPWWRQRLTAILLTLGVALFLVLAITLVVAGPELAEFVTARLGMSAAVEWAWKILQWPLVFLLVASAIGLVYYFAPDVDQDFVWITPGSLLATVLWLVGSLAFRVYVVNFGSYNETYGTIGGVMVLMLWLYLSGMAIVLGAELNAEIEHASPYGKDPGEKRPGEKKRIGALAERVWTERKRAGSFQPALAAANCDIDRELPAAVPTAPARARFSDLVLGGLAVVPAAAMAFMKTRKQTKA